MAKKTVRSNFRRTLKVTNPRDADEVANALLARYAKKSAKKRKKLRR